MANILTRLAEGLFANIKTKIPQRSLGVSTDTKQLVTQTESTTEDLEWSSDTHMVDPLNDFAAKVGLGPWAGASDNVKDALNELFINIPSINFPGFTFVSNQAELEAASSSFVAGQTGIIYCTQTINCVDLNLGGEGRVDIYGAPITIDGDSNSFNTSIANGATRRLYNDFGTTSPATAGVDLTIQAEFICQFRNVLLPEPLTLLGGGSFEYEKSDNPFNFLGGINIPVHKNWDSTAFGTFSISVSSEKEFLDALADPKISSIRIGIFLLAINASTIPVSSGPKFIFGGRLAFGNSLVDFQELSGQYVIQQYSTSIEFATDTSIVIGASSTLNVTNALSSGNVTVSTGTFVYEKDRGFGTITAISGGTVSQTLWHNTAESDPVSDFVNQCTGLVTGGLVTVNAGNPANFDMTAGTGYIVDNFTDPLNPTRKRVDFGPFTNESVPDILADDFTVLYIDDTGSLLKVGGNAFPNESDFRDKIGISAVIHPGNLGIITDTPNNPINTPTANAYFAADYLLAFGSLNRSGNELTGNAGLTVNKNIGQIFSSSINFQIDPKNPSTKTIQGETDMLFVYAWRTTTGFDTSNPTTTWSPGLFDDINNLPVQGAGAPLGNVNNTNWANHRFYVIDNGTYIVQYGQTEYANRTAAIEGRNNEVFAESPNVERAAFIGFATVRGGAASFSAENEFTFLLASGVAGGSPSSAVNLQIAYVNSNANPEILTDDNGMAVTIRRGSTGGDTDPVLCTQNGAGDDVWIVDGNGTVTQQGQLITSAPVTVVQDTAGTDGIRISPAGVDIHLVDAGSLSGEFGIRVPTNINAEDFTFTNGAGLVVNSTANPPKIQKLSVGPAVKTLGLDANDDLCEALSGGGGLTFASSYPVCLISSNFTSAGTLYATRFIPESDMSITQVLCMVLSGGSSGSVSMGVYDNLGSKNLLRSEVATLTGDGITLTPAFASLNLTAGATYWLALHGFASPPQYGRQYSSVASMELNISLNTSFGNLPSTLSGGVATSNTPWLAVQ